MLRTAVRGCSNLRCDVSGAKNRAVRLLQGSDGLPAPYRLQLPRRIGAKRDAQSVLGPIRISCGWSGRSGSTTCAPVVCAQRHMSSDADRDPTSREMPDPIPLHPFLLESLRGVGQVVFCNSTLSGAFILAGLFIGAPKLAVLCGLGSVSATAAARMALMDSGAIKAGLMGYNGALVGCAFSAFLGMPFVGKAIATVLGAGASAFVASKLGGLTALVPQWTLAFNLIALSALSIVQPLAKLPPPPEPTDWRVLDSLDWCEALLNGVSQIFVISNPWTGVLVLAGIFCYSQRAAAATLLGSALGILAAYCGQVDADQAQRGYWGYNPALTALAVSIFFVPVGYPYLALMCGGALAAAATTVVMKIAVGFSLQAPTLTLPFCMVASGCFLMPGRVPGLQLARTPHSPEVNLHNYYRGM